MKARLKLEASDVFVNERRVEDPVPKCGWKKKNWFNCFIDERDDAPRNTRSLLLLFTDWNELRSTEFSFLKTRYFPFLMIYAM